MSAAERPWWATAVDAPGTLDDDPLEAHRAARRGPERPSGPAMPPGGSTEGADDPVVDGGPTDRGAIDDGSWWVPATEAFTRLARDLAASATASPPRGLLDEQAPDRTSEDGHREDPEDTGPARPRGDDGGPGGGGGHRIDACGVCPICVGLRALGDARPDLVVHLAEAARQLALAVRTVVDAAVPTDEADPSSPPRRGAGGRRSSEDLHRIDLDD